MFLMVYEVKIYIFLLCLSCLFLLVRERVKSRVLITYFLASIFGTRTITCLITGKCYYEVYYLLIVYGIINVLFIFNYAWFSQLFPKFFKLKKKNKN